MQQLEAKKTAVWNREDLGAAYMHGHRHTQNVKEHYFRSALLSRLMSHRISYIFTSPGRRQNNVLFIMGVRNIYKVLILSWLGLGNKTTLNKKVNLHSLRNKKKKVKVDFWFKTGHEHQSPG